MRKLAIILLICSALFLSIAICERRHTTGKGIKEPAPEKWAGKTPPKQAPQETEKAVPPAERKVSRTEKDGEIARTADFELQDINGKTFRLSDFSGNIIILNFFATWCPPCQAEMPDFNQIAREYAKDVTIIAINVGNEPPSKVEGFVKANNLRFIVAMDDGYVSRLYGPINAIPVTYIIDRNFNIAKKYLGAKTKEVFVKDIESLR